ncbi:17760_t:CDS:10 [Funneliformis geosporum]|uniref:8569_t:CDS:1 n=1 Tax=Funneliformis geosporum TaxID=1117311 RepID=A0A9W4SHT0_9GLOM|nr:17760_t:CDS:10 [Funneliformis geosporum]CAI2170235.1 8569_t:CDS:10 [Funneliformis geosporum]
MAPFQTLDHHTDDALECETKYTLNEKTWAEIIALCQERGLNAEGDKASLIKVLWDWKQNTRPVPAPSTPRLFSADESSSPRQNKINSVYISSFFLDDDTSEIKYEDLEVGSKLGSGGFKDCFAGKYKGELVAIGELRSTNFSETDLKEIRHEINVLKQLRHENIVQFLGVCSNTKHLCIVTELCEHGDMFDYMRRVPRPSFSQQDMKSMNILISSDLRAKINDFGLARIRPRANASIHTQCGTPNWQAPEFWTSNPSYSEKVDVYACGLIFWEIMTWGEAGYPYQNYSEHQLYEAVRDKNVRPPIDNLRNYPVTLLKLVESMWQKDPKARPSMSNVVDSLVEYLS